MSTPRNSFRFVQRLGTSSSLAFVISAAPLNAAADDSRAESLFRSGREAIVRGDTVSGCAQLAESDRIEPSPGAKLGLAICEEQLGHRAAAWALLHMVMRSLDVNDERWIIAKRHSDELRASLAFVTVRLPEALPPGIRVASDVTELTASDLATSIAFDPGRHFLQISAPDFETKRITLLLQAGAHHEVELSLGKPISRQLTGHKTTMSPPASGVGARGAPYRQAGLAVGASTAALLLVGLTSGALALREKHRMDQACNDGACSEAGVRAAARGETFASVSTGSFIGAAIGAGIGAALFFVGSELSRARSQVSVRMDALELDF